jgi:hypothetical protein
MSGCATYEGYTTYGSTRKLLNSKAPTVAKAAFSPIVFIPDTVVSPFTSYLDSVAHAPESSDSHVYLSYVGLRTMKRCNIDSPLMVLAGAMVMIVDTVWFPIAGSVDTVYVLTR